MKIVLDTNVLVSALFSQNGSSNKVLIWLFENSKKVNVISNTLVSEYTDVLLREENLKQYANLSKADIEMFLDDICLISYHQNINFLWRPFLKDIKDDMVLEVAFNSSANYIVTNNTKDFKNVEKNFNIKVVTTKEFLEII
ncbi:PIN domain-containing protein [Malaciobacter pacificus]|uniref:PIN domain-containing protein n=1 Tax=Malaciobacter pacificus TaxID=1080223 RepID=A0A5C2H700_9BACT|nr:putative toxin-antitoxin system toxin component, PIN family [Malaciobacter pacificus]QEP34089.1 PIN domain-containing protein [Malaciobacter pacificus]GGD40332.1 PIN domain-containing protein [Malaciobacter pacificus]